MNDMRGHAKLVALGGALPTSALVALVAHGCKEPTQVTVDVKTNVECADMRGVDVAVGSDPRRAEERASLIATAAGPRFPSGSTKECIDGPPPRAVGTLVVTPSGSAGAVVVIAAFGQTNVADCVAPELPPRCIIARRRFSFVDHRRITMPIVLDPDCAGIPCNETSTCVGKKCVDSEIDCSGAECTEPGVGADGGVVEVDAFSPLVDGAPPDDGAVSDGPVSTDGGNDAGGGDAGTDADSGAGSAFCPGVAGCLPAGGGAAMCAAVPPVKCCYAQNGASCMPASSKVPCAGTTACCHGSSPCAAGEVCCADTDPRSDTTVIACRPPGQCLGPRVCSVADMDCHGMGACRTDWPAWTTDPDYFFCS